MNDKKSNGEEYGVRFIGVPEDRAIIEELVGQTEQSQPAGFFEFNPTAKRNRFQYSEEEEQRYALSSYFAKGLYQKISKLAGESRLDAILNESYKIKIPVPTDIELLEEIATNPAGFIYLGERSTTQGEYTISSFFYYSLGKEDPFRGIAFTATFKDRILKTISPISRGNEHFLKDCLGINN